MPDPDPLDGTVEPFFSEDRVRSRALHRGYERGYADGIVARSEVADIFPEHWRWYLLASFVTGLLLGAAVARL